MKRAECCWAEDTASEYVLYDTFVESALSRARALSERVSMCLRAICFSDARRTHAAND